MDWIDFSGLEVDDLDKGWSSHSLKTHLSQHDTAKLGDVLLLSMQDKSLAKGDIKIVKDHVNLSAINPLRGKNQQDLGVRFPDMSHPYEKLSGPYDSILVRAGQDKEHPFSAIEASEIIYQTILAKHQGKKVYAVIYGVGVDSDKIINIFRGE